MPPDGYDTYTLEIARRLSIPTNRVDEVLSRLASFLRDELGSGVPFKVDKFGEFQYAGTPGNPHPFVADYSLLVAIEKSIGRKNYRIPKFGITSFPLSLQGAWPPLDVAIACEFFAAIVTDLLDAYQTQESRIGRFSFNTTTRALQYHPTTFLGVAMSNGIAVPVKAPPSKSTTSGIKLRISVPEWIDENDAAEEIEELIRCINATHIACGGNGLVLGGWEIDTTVPVRGTGF